MKTYEHIGLAAPDVLLPADGVDPTRWAVIACDQYTSQPDYWDRVEAAVGDAPSTLRMIYPEVFLGEADPDARVAGIQAAMRGYLEGGQMQEHAGFVYVERDVPGEGQRTRRGLVACIDLDAYDYTKGSASLATVAPGIAEALIATAAGLAAAIPAVMAYNYILGQVRRLETELNDFAADLAPLLTSPEKFPLLA